MWFITSVSSFHWYIFLYIQKQLFCYMCNAWIWWELRTRCARLKGNRSFFQILPRLSIYKRLKHHIRIHFIPHVRILLRATIKYNDHGSVLSAGVKSQTFLHWKKYPHIYRFCIWPDLYGSSLQPFGLLGAEVLEHHLLPLQLVRLKKIFFNCFK